MKTNATPTASRTPIVTVALSAALGLLACSEKSPDPEPSSSGGEGGQMTANGGTASGGQPGAGGNSAGDTALGGTPSGGTAALADAGAAGGSAGMMNTFPDDGLMRDPAFSAGSVPLPEARTDIPMLLSQTGLYANAANEVFAYDVRLYEPQFELWSDSAEKRRWFYLPEGEQIDTTDMNNWRFPIGTKVWKEFTRDGKRIETRILWRIAEGGRGWISVAYVWNEDQSDAVATPDGLENASATNHDVPNQKQCEDCHAERRDLPLSVSAVQLSHDGAGMTLTDLIDRNLLSAPPAGNFSLPGNEVEQAALGYMHANCGHCHRADSSAALRADLRTWLLVEQLDDLQMTDAYTYLVNQDVFSEISDLEKRAVGGSPEMSEVVRRMQLRQEGEGPMPPLGTEDVDEAGLKSVTDWIEALPPPE